MIMPIRLNTSFKGLIFKIPFIFILIFILNNSALASIERNGPYNIYLGSQLDSNNIDNTINVNRDNSTLAKGINIYYYNIIENGNERIIVNITEYLGIQFKDPLTITKNVKEILRRNGASEGTIETTLYEVNGCSNGDCVGIKGEGKMMYAMNGKEVTIYALQYWINDYIYKGLDICCTVVSKFPEESDSETFLSNFKIDRDNFEGNNV